MAEVIGEDALEHQPIGADRVDRLAQDAGRGREAARRRQRHLHRGRAVARVAGDPGKIVQAADQHALVVGVARLAIVAAGGVEPVVDQPVVPDHRRAREP